MTNPVAVDRAHGGAALEGAIDFSISINPLGPPPAAADAYRSALDRISTYPPARSTLLETRLAEWIGVDPENVVAGNGTTQLIYLLARVLEPSRPFVVIPTFSEIANALAGEGLPPEPIQLDRDNEYRLDIKQIEYALAGHAGAIFLGRPNSPTGGLLTMAEAEEIADRCARRGCWCVIDEAFIDFVDPPDSGAKIVARNPRLVVLRSLTKSFAIPGLRLGCVIADRDLTAALRNAIEPWSVSVVAESVGLACIDHSADYLARTRTMVAKEREYLHASLGKRRIRVFHSAANFMMLEIPAEAEPGEWGRQLLEREIAVRDLKTLPGCGPGLYRIGIRNRPDNQRLVDAIDELASRPGEPNATNGTNRGNHTIDPAARRRS